MSHIYSFNNCLLRASDVPGINPPGLLQPALLCVTDQLPEDSRALTRPALTLHVPQGTKVEMEEDGTGKGHSGCLPLARYVVLI